MTYLIIHNNEAFFTNWYDYENNYVPGMIVIIGGKISFDGITFTKIPQDHL